MDAKRKSQERESLDASHTCPICGAAVERDRGFDFHALGRTSVYFDRIECVLLWLRRTHPVRWREADEDA